MTPLPQNTYCAFVQERPADDRHRQYHDEQYGFPLQSDDALFGRLLLEINQAGLSWDLILKKRDAFKAAYANFSIAEVANFQEADRSRLLNNAGIIRNKLKVNAVIHNARVIQGLQQSEGSFKAWLDQYRDSDKKEWVRLFKKYFKFTGGEITGEFLMSTGYLPGAHHPECPIYPSYQGAIQRHWP